MELHDHLYALGLQVGREVFDDPEGFRGVLDDFLEEDEATTGDINLLVDAVRLGAFRSMLTMLDSGADAASAVSEAGLRLARDRGSADAGSAQWACAVLGFAIGRVGEADVARFRSSTAPPALDNGAATELPPVPGPAVPAPPQPSQAQPTPPPQPYSYPAPPVQQPSYPAPPAQQPSYPASQQQPAYQIAPQTQGYPPQPKKPKTGVILAVLGTSAAVVIAIILALVLAGGGDDDPQTVSSTTDPTTEPTTSEPTTSEPTTSEPPTSEPPTSEPPTTPAVDPGGQVSTGDAGDFTQALLDFSDAFGTASTDLGNATSNDDYDAALEANAAVRKSVYDLDLAVRELDLDAVADARNEFLTQSGLMIEGLDETYMSATTALEIGLDFGELPLQQYTDSFTALSTAITDSAYS